MSKKIVKPLYKYQLIDIFRVLHKYRYLIGGITLFGAILSVIISFVLPVYFESKTLVYPVSMTMADRSVIFGQQQGQAEFSYFGNKYDASRILQVANSSEIFDYVYNKYHLAEHYKYKADEKFLYTKVKKDFLENYHAFKNDKDAIELTLLDTDKDTCAIMLNDIVSKVNEIATKPVIESKETIISMLTKELQEKKHELINGQHETFEKENLRSQISKLSETLTQYEASANENFNAITVLEKAVPAEKKSKPVRWIIVVFGTIASWAFSLLLALGYTQYRFIKKNL